MTRNKNSSQLCDCVDHCVFRKKDKIIKRLNINIAYSYTIILDPGN